MEKRDGKTSVLRVGPFAGLSAIVFWGTIAAFIITAVAMATPYWVEIEDYHQGLCQDSVCVEIPASSVLGKHHWP